MGRVSDLLWPGDERAGELLSEPALLRAMIRVESAWLGGMTGSGIAPADASTDLTGLVTARDVPEIAAHSEAGGNPVTGLLALLRERVAARSPETATWLHRGLTSQDVLDTALMLCVRDVLDRIGDDLGAQVRALTVLADGHRASVMAGRTLTQHAVPITFGLKAASWLQDVLDAAEDVAAIRLPAQLGGAAGTLAATTALAQRAGLDPPVDAACRLTREVAATLGLHAVPPWHTARAPVTRLGDALVRCTDAWGRIANDVLTLSRPEIAELAEPAADGRGSSSTMPHKANPVLSVLVRRTALTAPSLGAQLHLAAAESLDERPDGAWHSEWSALRTLGRRAVVAACQTAELLAGLQVHGGRMRETARQSAEALLAERAGLPEPPPGAGDDPASYLGANDPIIDSVLARAARYLEETR